MCFCAPPANSMKKPKYKKKFYTNKVRQDAFAMLWVILLSKIAFSHLINHQRELHFHAFFFIFSQTLQGEGGSPQKAFQLRPKQECN